MKARKMKPYPDCQDILHCLKDRQYLLRCLDNAIGDAYYQAAGDDAREVIQQMSTLLEAYDIDKVVESLEKAIALLEEVGK